MVESRLNVMNNEDKKINLLFELDYAKKSS